ncbi:lachrymatory-factor synthase-like [Rutidosis leptorrhynchoides]|uniref:lachrymatory-factor synthase-like n=1 Tax=Rutidosis leptorrhynchoides TaxID=125765 RepID=UPI003A999B7D
MGSLSIPNVDGGVDQVSWSKERLVAVDQNKMSMTYEMVDCNIGYKSYVSTIKIVSDEIEGCVVNWSFSVDPIEGLRFDYLVRKYQDGLDQTAKNMEDALFQKDHLG